MAPNKPKPDKVFTFKPQTPAQIARNPINLSVADSTPPSPPVAAPTVSSGSTNNNNADNDLNSPANVQKAADTAAALRDQAQRDAETAIRNQQETTRRKNATATMQALLTQYNLMSLYDKVVEYIKDGYDGDSIPVLLRTTPEYKQRFPAMESLSKKGRAISEASYIDYEQQAAALERRYGLPSNMLMNNVTSLLSNDISAAELNDRVMLASSASLQAPQQLKDTFKNYYGIDAGGLTAYFLDPNVAAPLLEKQYASSIIGAEAIKQGVAIDVYGAENLENIGITQDQAREGFGIVAASKALTKGRGDVTTQDELIAGTLGQNATARQNIERAAAARAGRFQGGGQFVQTQEGNVGLKTATTR